MSIINLVVGVIVGVLIFVLGTALVSFHDSRLVFGLLGALVGLSIAFGRVPLRL